MLCILIVIIIVDLSKYRGDKLAGVIRQIYKVPLITSSDKAGCVEKCILIQRSCAIIDSKISVCW